MPDLEDRLKREDELAAALLFILMEQKDRVTTEGPIDYSRFSREMENALTEHLARTYEVARNKMLNEQAAFLLLFSGEFLFPEQYSGRVWARPVAEEITRLVVTSTEEKVNKARAEAKQAAAEAGDAQREVVELLNKINHLFAKERAQSIAITETTRAISTGEQTARVVIEREFGVDLVAYWITEVDEFGVEEEGDPGGVCPICFPLHEKPEKVWVDRFPFGPPAHPRCRCHKAYARPGEMPSELGTDQD